MSHTDVAEIQEHERHGSNLHLSIIAPREPKPRKMTFEKNTRVGEAAREAGRAFGYVGGNPTFQNAKDEILDRNKTLAGEHVRDGDTLRYVDVGGGV